MADPRRSAQAATKLKVRVSPKRVKAGRRTVLRVRVTAAGAPVKGATVRLGKGKAKGSRSVRVAKPIVGARAG